MRRRPAQREDQRGEGERRDEEILPVARLADGLRDDRMEGEEERACDRRREQPALRPPASGAIVPEPIEEEPDKHHVEHVEKDTREVVAEGAFPPQRGVKHERRKHRRPVEVEDIHPQHASAPHRRPVPRIVDERIGEDLEAGVVDEVAAQRRHEGEEGRGGQEADRPPAPPTERGHAHPPTASRRATVQAVS